jgi:hypothetical protein
MAETKNPKRKEYAKVQVPTSRMFFTQSVSLSTTQANRVYRRNYGSMSRYLHQIQVTMNFVRSNKVASQAEALVSKMLDDVRASLTKDLATIDEMRKQNGISAEPKSDHVSQYSVEIKTPLDAEFLMLIQLLDKCVMHLFTLFVTKNVSSEAYHSECYRMQQKLQKLVGRVINVAGVARKNADTQGVNIEEIIKRGYVEYARATVPKTIDEAAQKPTPVEAQKEEAIAGAKAKKPKPAKAKPVVHKAVVTA